jgi:hypothetical protein
MALQPSLIMIQFLEWVAARPRRREDVLDAWQSSCPRFPVWEDARAEGLVRQAGGAQGEHRVELTEAGRQAIACQKNERPEYQRPEDQRIASGSAP